MKTTKEMVTEEITRLQDIIECRKALVEMYGKQGNKEKAREVKALLCENIIARNFLREVLGTL